MKFENTEIWGFKHALRGVRNPLESWHKSDSYVDTFNGKFMVGKNDLKLAQTLIKADSPSHRKFMRQIFVSVDIAAPLYWWKEMDQYKVGTTTNSTSTMHRISTTQITRDCFEISAKTKDDNYFLNFINHLESLRKEYIETKDKETWKTLIQELPSSWLQTRTITLSYENIYSMINQRSGHKLTEWSVDFIDWCKTLLYANELLFI